MMESIQHLQKNRDQDQQNQSEQEESGLVSVSKTDKPNKRLPQAYYKAKKVLTRLINSYFKQIKSELVQKQGNIDFHPQQLDAVEAAISKYITIRYKNIEQLTIQRHTIHDEQLLYYTPETKSLWKFNKKIQSIEIESADSACKLPDIATPVSYGSNVFLLDGANLDEKRGVFMPSEHAYRINMVTGQASKIKSLGEYRVRMKSAVIKSRDGVYIIGGYVGQQKTITRKAEYFDVKKQSMQAIPNTHKIHVCPSGCLHQSKVYIFSQIGIEQYDPQNQYWTQIKLAKRLVILPFQFYISISEEQIMALGGRYNDRCSNTVNVINLKEDRCDIYPQILPTGVCSERSSMPCIIHNHVALISSIQASRYPYICNKAHSAEVLYFGSKGCFISEIKIDK